MIDVVSDLGRNGIGLLLLATWRALPLLLIVLLVDLALGRRLPAKYHAICWALVVFRLLLPMSLPSPWSLHGPLNGLSANWRETQADHAMPTSPYDLVASSSTYPGEWPVSTVPQPELEPAAPAPDETINSQSTWLTSLVAIWALLAAGCLLRGWLAHVGFAFRLRTCRELTDAQLVALVVRECDHLRVRRPVLKVVPELTAPAVFGLLRATICLPEQVDQRLSEQELRWVLRHELAHVRRRDAWLLSLAWIMRSLHWFNPLAWLVNARLRSYVELSADQMALGACSPAEATAYGRLLLRFAEQTGPASPSPALGYLPFVAGDSLRGRIEKLTYLRTTPFWARCLAVTATLALAAAGLTDAAPPSAPPSETVPLPRIEIAEVFKGNDEGPVSPFSYDVDQVLERIRQVRPEADAEKTLLDVCQVHLAGRPAQIAGSRLTTEVTADQRRALTTMLQAWSHGGPREIAIEVRVIRAETACASSIDWSQAFAGPLMKNGSQPVIAAHVTDDQMRSFIRAVQADARSQELFAPKVTLFNGQTAMIADLVKRPFVTAVQPQEDGSTQPVVEVIEEGLKLTLIPVVVDDNTIELTFDLRVSKLGDVAAATRPSRTGAQQNATVQVPSVSVTRVSSSVRLSMTESVVISAPVASEGNAPKASTTAVFYAFTPRLISPIAVSNKRVSAEQAR